MHFEKYGSVSYRKHFGLFLSGGFPVSIYRQMCSSFHLLGQERSWPSLDSLRLVLVLMIDPRVLRKSILYLSLSYTPSKQPGF